MTVTMNSETSVRWTILMVAIKDEIDDDDRMLLPATLTSSTLPKPPTPSVVLYVMSVRRRVLIPGGKLVSGAGL